MPDHLAGVEARAVVLVEGTSDQRALEALAERRGRDLDAEGVSIVSIGGARRSEGSYAIGPEGSDLRLAGLCDVGEVRDFRRGLERAGLGSDLTRKERTAGFLRLRRRPGGRVDPALGTDAVEEVVDAQGELGSFRTLQKQAAWRGRATDEQLRRFMGSGGRRKIRYARLLVEALDLTQVPRPLDLVLAHV